MLFPISCRTACHVVCRSACRVAGLVASQISGACMAATSDGRLRVLLGRPYPIRSHGRDHRAESRRARQDQQHGDGDELMK
jgi:hypothetical protein